jgi:SAM-dependent methyltransferase
MVKVRDVLKANAMLAPDPWIMRYVDLIPPGGTVLDIAAGGGRHTALALDLGHDVMAVDRDVSRLEELGQQPTLRIEKHDLEQRGWSPGGQQFQGIIVCNYLWRPLFRPLIDALAPGGVLIWTTFALGNERFGRPRNPDFLLHRNELAEAVLPELELIGFFESEQPMPQPSVRQGVCARRADVDPERTG